MNDEFLNIILPDSWVWSKSKEIGLIINGDRGKNYPSRRHYVETGIPFITAGHLSDGKLSFNEMNYITESKFEALSSGKLLLGDIIYCLRGTLGKCAIYMVDKRAAIASSLTILRLNTFVNRKYVFYYLQSPFGKELVRKYDNGTAQPNLSAESFANYTIPIPPLPEQHHIVAKIEELFSSLDKGIENLKTAQQQLKVYRQAVLKWAFEGKLTNRNVAEGELPEGWRKVKLGEVIKTIDGDRGPNYPKKDELIQKGYCLFLSTKNVREDSFVFEDNIFISKEKDEILRGGKLQLSDVIITTRGTLGNVALYDEKIPYKHIRINSGMLILRRTNESLNNYYLMKFITSPIFISQLKERQTGTAQQQIPANVLREIEIPLSHIPEQHAIVQEIESRLSVCDKIEESIEHSLKQSEALRQSILKKAFEGKLVPQDPNDEPASVLLDRIKAEREKSKLETPPRRQAGQIKAKKAKS